VLIHPVAVQGAQAAVEIVAALKTAGARLECDVLILARGGGSLEDLWAFNDEQLARAIVASPIPVICGVGHEVDFTIADFAADVRAPTPSAAAELVVPDAEEWLITALRLGTRLARCMRRHLSDRRERLRWLTGRAGQVSPIARLAQQTQRLDELDQRMSRALRRRLTGHRERLHWLRGRAALVSPAARLAQYQSRLVDLEQRLARAMRQLQNGRLIQFRERRNRLWHGSPLERLRTLTARQEALAARLEAAQLEVLSAARERLLPLVRTLNAVSPLATLDRGYAIVMNAQGRILRDAADAAAGTIIEARLAAGSVRARVEGS
jgi:exodeoxyribonuclease VII large subunit